jgi:hypothetical protein
MVARDAVKDSMNSEEKWRSFRQQLAAGDKGRFHRFNVVLRDGVPGMQDYSAIEALGNTALTYCSLPSVDSELKMVARKLAASTFYFEFKAWTRPGQKWECSGFLHNRLSPTHPDAVEELVNRRPIFKVYEDGATESILRVEVGPHTEGKERWRVPVEFSVVDKNRRMDIKVKLPVAEGDFSISGFPRVVS